MSGKFDLKDYVDVKTRIAEFYAKYPDGRLVTDVALGSSEPDDVPRIWVKALAYRTADDPHPGVGWSWMQLPGSTPYTRGSEIENAETSAWGRAIGALGIGIAASIATTDEIAAKEGTKEPEPAPTMMAEDGEGLIGTVEARKPPADMELRQTPDGFAYGFGLVGPKGRGRIQVIAKGDLASAVHDAGLKADERVTVWGELEFVEWKGADGSARRPYQRLWLSRIQTEEWTLPAPDDLADIDFDAVLPAVTEPTDAA